MGRTIVWRYPLWVKQVGYFSATTPLGRMSQFPGQFAGPSISSWFVRWRGPLLLSDSHLGSLRLSRR